MPSCPKCGKDNEWGFYKEVCDSCKNKQARIITMSIIGLGLILSILSIFYMHYDFNYKVDRCSKLTSSQSNYDFNLKVEIDADYNKDCYYLTNHAFAYFWHITVLPIVLILFSVLIGLAIGVAFRI